MTNYNYSFLKLVNMTFFFETRDIDWKKTRIIVITDKFNSKRYISVTVHVFFKQRHDEYEFQKFVVQKKKKSFSAERSSNGTNALPLYIIVD